MNYWIRQLFSRPGTHVKAFIEVLVTTIISLIPLLLSAIVANYKNGGDFEFHTTVQAAIGGGQLFLYAYGLIGTIIWLAFIKWDVPMSPPRRLFGFITFICSLIVVALVSQDPTVSNVKNPALLKASAWTYSGFLVVNYLLIFYLEIEPPAANNSLNDGVRRLQRQYHNLENANE